MEDLARGSTRPKVDVQSLNTRAYLDHTVVPILLDAMAVVARERWVDQNYIKPDKSGNKMLGLAFSSIKIKDRLS